MIVNIREKNQGSVWAWMGKCNYLTHLDAMTFNLFVFGQFLQKKIKIIIIIIIIYNNMMTVLYCAA